ncbi:MAG: DUF1549 domain-containing protein, partial [Opitutales bacterium]|nr:DUF1549 domain-containing protein [Opitutales bacterium]
MLRPALSAIALIVSLLPGALAGAIETIDFNRDIRPILSEKCFHCHGPDPSERKGGLRDSGGLRLDTEEGSRMDLGGFAALIPGDLEQSELVARIKDIEDPMPPEESHKALSLEEVNLLERWIVEGAEYSAPWTYERPIKTELPRVADEAWPINPVDRFVLARLENEGLAPSPETEPVTLIRRLYFDLTGLPPTPDKAAAFVNGEATLEQVVDDLLESPHFGERMAMYWLDLVRYADTVGYHGDQDHNISPYRDYVIRSFNENLPFDQFTR